MKYELGCCTKRFSLCFLFSSAGNGCNKSLASYTFFKIGRKQKILLVLCLQPYAMRQPDELANIVLQNKWGYVCSMCQFHHLMKTLWNYLLQIIINKLILKTSSLLIIRNKWLLCRFIVSQCKSRKFRFFQWRLFEFVARHLYLRHVWARHIVLQQF